MNSDEKWELTGRVLQAIGYARLTGASIPEGHRERADDDYARQEVFLWAGAEDDRPPHPFATRHCNICSDIPDLAGDYLRVHVPNEAVQTLLHLTGDWMLMGHGDKYRAFSEVPNGYGEGESASVAICNLILAVKESTDD